MAYEDLSLNLPGLTALDRQNAQNVKQAVDLSKMASDFTNPCKTTPFLADQSI